MQERKERVVLQSYLVLESRGIWKKRREGVSILKSFIKAVRRRAGHDI